jgi:hypothetical protein
MKLIMTIIGTLMVWATPVLASSGTEETGASLLVILFLGFGALIVLGQLIPGLVLFCTMMKGLFSKIAIKTTQLPVHKEEAV